MHQCSRGATGGLQSHHLPKLVPTTTRILRSRKHNTKCGVVTTQDPIVARSFVSPDNKLADPVEAATNNSWFFTETGQKGWVCCHGTIRFLKYAIFDSTA